MKITSKSGIVVSFVQYRRGNKRPEITCTGQAHLRSVFGGRAPLRPPSYEGQVDWQIHRARFGPDVSCAEDVDGEEGLEGGL